MEQFNQLLGRCGSHLKYYYVVEFVLKMGCLSFEVGKQLGTRGRKCYIIVFNVEGLYMQNQFQ